LESERSSRIGRYGYSRVVGRIWFRGVCKDVSHPYTNEACHED
jgi:hypothetical protein